MGLQVVHGALTSCIFGSCSARLKVSPPKLRASLEFDMRRPEFGVFQSFDMDGNLSFQANFEGGLLQGESLVFNAAGMVSQKLSYDAGQLEGASLFNEGGGLMGSLSFNAGGLLNGTASFYAAGMGAMAGIGADIGAGMGAMGGIEASIGADIGAMGGMGAGGSSGGGMIASLSFANGLQDGMSQFFNAEGQLSLQMNFMGGLENGLRTTFDAASGAVLNEEMFVNGVLEGEMSADLGADLSASLDLGLELPTEDLDFDINLGGFACSRPMASIMDFAAFTNIGPFCLCSSPANPAVAAATAAAGVLTPQPCTPNIQSPWIPGSSKVSIANNPALNNSSTLVCAYAGIISVDDAGQKPFLFLKSHGGVFLDYGLREIIMGFLVAMVVN